MESKDTVYINRFNGKVVDENYPETDKYIRADENTIVLQKVENEEGSCDGCYFCKVAENGEHVCTIVGACMPQALRCNDTIGAKTYIFELRAH